MPPARRAAVALRLRMAAVDDAAADARERRVDMCMGRRISYGARQRAPASHNADTTRTLHHRGATSDVWTLQLLAVVPHSTTSLAMVPRSWLMVGKMQVLACMVAPLDEGDADALSRGALTDVDLPDAEPQFDRPTLRIPTVARDTRQYTE